MRRQIPARRIAALLALLALAAAAGCGGSKTAPALAPLPGGLSLEVRSSTPVNGLPISLTLVRPGSMATIYVPPGGHVYSLTYWSRGERAQAYLTVPAGRKPNPLFIDLHGGYYIAEPGHSDDVYWTREEAIVNAQAHAVAFLPNYVGYGPSGGKVGDASEDTQDVENGLQALAQIRGMRLERNATYLLGFSLGGAVGMLLAGQDRQVRAVALDSPWPGGRMSLGWYQTNYFHLNRDELLGYKILTRYEGSNTANRWYRRNSYGCQDVHMPLLIVGGTEDDIVPQAMLATMAANLKGCGQNVEFKLFPGGHSPYGGDEQALIQAWFQRQGISLQL